MFAEKIADLPTTLRDFSHEGVDAASWQRLPNEVRAALVAEGEASLADEMPALLLTDYLAYTRTGDRAAFEAKYFARRRQLNALVLAECVERGGRFIDRIADGVWALCEESGWQLPAHNSHERGKGRQPLPDPDNPVIDLFAAETGAQLAVLVRLLGKALDTVAPGTVARVDQELERRIFEPYLQRHFWWMGRGDEPMNNWTAWCTQNVLLAAFCRPTSQDVRRDVLAKAFGSLDAFLKDYGEDGACEEGVLYYRHAGLCLFNAMTVIDSAAPGVLTDVWREAKIGNMAEYVVHMHVDGTRYFNFADSPAVAGRCGAREFLFGQAVGSQMLTDFAAVDWAAERQLTLPDEINLFYRVQAAFTVDALSRHVPGPIHKPDVFLPSIGLFVARDERFAVAVKGGDNGDSHNHNDVGSVIVYRDGQPVLIDAGVETYSAKTFSAQRYGIWTMQSAYHNLPTFEGVMQRDGEDYRARDVRAEFGDETASIEMDIADAYPAEAKVRSYRRKVRLNRGRNVEIVDRCDGDCAATLSLMLCEKPALDGSTLTLPSAIVRFEGATTMTVEPIAVSDARLRASWPDTLYRVLVRFSGMELRFTIE